ncbi:MULTISPECIES: helix-turn-helix transcriptional regulator [Idiomarina]|uniref:helix-turn-helix transcriptional regulator n=1 Tax=Idiomarina TaxID=135575 RepID=UPI00258AFD6A|nr:LuxR C-terminal-related transcriptional regulator [Idiomarina sp.]
MTIDRILMVVLALIAVANISDVFADYQMQVAAWHLIVESITVIISTVAFIILWFRIRRRNGELKSLKEALSRSQRNSEQTENDDSGARVAPQPDEEEYSYMAVKEWFKQWKFSPSEQEVAILLIKGLTFNEIAEVRNTKEKTVRQQASSVYSKSGLNGRNNLSAWLIDALLD